MSKAEERALEAYHKKIEWVGNQWDGGPLDVNSESRNAYKQGYQQAEKDLELTWEDVRDICRMWIESKTPFGVTGEALSMEVLKRFKERKEPC